MGKKQFCFFQTAETGNRTPDSGVKGSGVNHYPRAPAQIRTQVQMCDKSTALLFGPELITLKTILINPLQTGTCLLRISDPLFSPNA